MKILDPGHQYKVAGYDRAKAQTITFMKREGPGYPGNVGHYGGTNCQELIRVLIDRVGYLDNQIPCDQNKAVLLKLKESLWLFEDRAALRHHIDQFDFTPNDIAEAPACRVCGHVVCRGHSRRRAHHHG